MSYNKKCRWFSMEYVGNPGAVPACNRDAVLEAFDCSTCKENQINANPTNADRIRAMRDEELAIIFAEGCHNTRECPMICAPIYPIYPFDEVVESCAKCWLKWLKQEADE